MAKKMTDEEIQEFINSKNVSQNSYVAPTVKTHVDTRNTQTVQPTIQTVKPTLQPTFNQFSQTNFNQPKTYTQVSNKPSFLEGAGYIGNAAKTGLVSGFTGIPNSALQETERALKKGENIKNTGDVLKQILNSLSSASNIQNPFASFLSNSGEYINNLKNIWSGNENTLSKLVNTGLEATSQATKATGTDLGRYADMVYPFVGAVNPNLDEKVSQLRGVINQPAQQMQQELQQEGQKFGTGMNMLASGVQSATNMAPSLLASAATGNPDIGLTVMLNNARGQATEEALREGKSLDEALKIGNAKGLVEYGTERMTGGVNLLGKGALDDVAEKWVNDNIKSGVKNFLAKQGLAVGGEMLEEITSDLAGTLIDKGTIDPNKTYTWNDLLNTIGPTAISTILINALTGGYGRNAYRQNLSEMNNIQDSVAKTADALNLGRTQLNEKVVPKTQEVTQTQHETVQEVAPHAQTEQTKPIAQETQNVSQMTNNEAKIQNFRDSVTRENIQDADGFYKAVEKIISDKDYNVIMDSSIKNADGKPVNASISNENGITIRINPNSERAGEILLMHEVTHGIETKEISDLIMNYASKNSEFNTALEDLKKTYGTQDVTPEVVADISGQLFGNQEFINNLSVEKPSVFKKIYDKIIEIANKITGNSKQALFVRDLANKWQKAYRESTIESSQKTLGEAVKYSQNATVDNKGRTLSKGQQERFKDSKARDNDGKLITLYHTVNHPVEQFNEFNPVGTPGYRFGNQFVTYLTDSQEMSGSYADQDYVKADTKKYETIEEVEDFINKFNDINKRRGDVWKIKDVSNDPVYTNSYREVLDSQYNSGRTAEEIEKRYRRGLLSKEQYDLGTKGIQYVIELNDKPYLDYFIPFSSKEDLLRNFKTKLSKKLQEKEKNPLSFDGSANEYNKQKWQYEVYANLKNPYEIDAEGRNWDNITRELKQEYKDVIDNMAEEEMDNLSDLALESQKKSQEWHMSDDYKEYKKFDDTFQRLNTTEQENLILASMKDKFTSQDYVDMYNQYGKEFGMKDPDSKITVNPYGEVKKEMSYKDFAAEWVRLEQEDAKYHRQDSYFRNNIDKKYLPIYGEGFFKTALFNFQKFAVDDYLTQKMTTNDVVKKIIEMNKNGSDYDGVIIRNTTDYGGWSEGREPHDVYVAFEPNQIKAVDNLDPTSDPDIRYSQKAKKWQEYLEKNFLSSGTTTNLKEKVEKVPKSEYNKTKKSVKLKEKNGKYTREDVVKTAEQAKKQFDNQTLTNKKGKKVSNFYSNITEKSQFIEPETREKLKTEDDIKYYKDVTNEQALNEAVDKIGTTPASQSKALHEFLNKQDQFTATDMAEGWVFLKQYQDAGNYDAMAQVAKKMREMGTKSGQAIQMLALEARLTPEGMYRFAVNELAEAEQKFNSEKGRKQSEIDRYRDNFQLTPEETDFIKTQMEKVQNMEPGRERDIEVAKINKMLSDKLPHEKGRSLKAWMRLSMLFNPKTQVRNVMGNALITPVNALADVAAGLTDKYVSKKTGVRTIGGPSLGGFAAYGKGAVKGLQQATQDYRLGLDTKNLNQNRFDIGQGKAFNEQHKGPFKNVRNAVAKGLNATNDLLGYVMDAGDRMFYQGSVENSLYNQQKLNNTNEVTQEMADIAVNEGLQRTWNDDNQFTQAVLNIRRAINDIGGLMHIKVGEYGLGDLMIPFAKTPANLTKAIVDYSPVGFLNAATEGKNLKRAIATGNYTMQQQHDFAQTLGKATAGSLLYALGIALAKAKITSGSGDEDKDLKNFMRYNLGIQPYSIKIGDKSFTYDWAQPVAAPLAITADIEKGITENMTPAQAIQQFLTTGFNVLSEQSFLSGVNEVLNDNDGLLHGIEQQVLNMPATAVPTLLKQFTDLIDPTKRQTYSKEGMTEQTKKYAMSKIPTESKKLAPQVDVLGNEIQKYGGDNNAFNVFLNPANTEKGKTSDVSEEIYALYEATGDKNIIPRKVDYSITLNGKKKILTTEEMAQWQKASGQYVTENVRKAMNNSDYQKMSNEDKAAVINKIVNYSFMKAKSETFGTDLSSYYSGVSKAEKKGIPMYDYYISRVKKG